MTETDLAEALREILAGDADEFEARFFVAGRKIDVVFPRETIELAYESVHAGERQPRRDREFMPKHVQLPGTAKEMTPHQAAVFLAISRPTLIKLLDAGEIPYRTLPNSRHRRIATEDVHNYYVKLRERDKDARREQWRKLMELTRELDLLDEQGEAVDRDR